MEQRSDEVWSTLDLRRQMAIVPPAMMMIRNFAAAYLGA
jgi:hypothetical protein